MSKRFGRNQKRKMRAEIVGLHEDLERARGWRERNKRLEQCVDDVRSVLGNHFCAFPPETTVLDRMVPVLQLHERPQPCEDWSLANDKPERLSLAIKHLDVVTTSSYMDELRAATHFRVEVGRNGSFGYAISEEAKRAMPKDYLIRMISTELARHIASEFKKGS